MKEFIEKLIGRLEELYARNDKTKKMAYEEKDWEKFDLFTHRCEGIYSAISIVNQLAEENNNGWIPVSEKLPEIDGNTSDIVLVCGSNGFQYMAFWCDDLKWRFCECGMAKNPVLWTEIIAWQPLPQPYTK